MARYPGEAASQVITAYLAAKGLSPSQALIRLDGLYGTTALLARIQPFKVGFLTRGRDYHLLDHPSIQARLQQPCDLTVTHAETQVQRDIFEVGFVADWLEERPDVVIPYRVILTRRAAPAERVQIAVGKLRGEHVSELFLTSHPATALPAATILQLYQHRGSFEQVLSDEDNEQDPDRWCSQTPFGQEFWQIISQWVSPTRLELGRVGQAQPLRWTTWETGQADTPASLPPESVMGNQAADTGDVVAMYGPLELAQPWAKARRRFSAQDFTMRADDTLECPAGKVLRLRERRKLDNGALRLLYAAQAHDCRTCLQARECVGQGASGAQPRRVSGIRRVVGWQMQAAPNVDHHRDTQVESQTDGLGARAVQWGDVGGRRLRRELVARLRRQQVTIAGPGTALSEPPPGAGPRLWTRAERAHRRLSWASRLARNARALDAPCYRVTLCGIAPPLAAYLGLPSTPAP